MDSGNSAVAKLETQVPIGCAELQRHTDAPSRRTIRRKSKVVGAVTPVCGQCLRIWCSEGDSLANLEQSRAVGFVVSVECKDIGEPESANPKGEDSKSDDGKQNMGRLDSHGRRAESPNDLKLSDSGVRRGTCAVGGKAAVEAGAVTHGAVRCSAWLGHVLSSIFFNSQKGWDHQH